MSYNRNLSPGGRRIANAARTSDSTVDTYLSSRHNSLVSPRSSGERVIPISTQTFVNVAPSTSTSSRSTGFDSYSGRPRRSSLVDTARSSTSSRRPNVVQGSDTTRTSSPSRLREYYVVPASSKESRHKKVYSVDDGGAKLVSEPSTAGAEHRHRHHRTRESEDQGYKDDRARRGYPTTRKDKSIDDDDAFSYTDAAGMYRDTQPSWRERDARPRRNSVDRGSSRDGVSRERPISMLEPYGQDSRKPREGPPPSQRGWGKINEGLGRSRSVRDGPREVARSPSRGRADDYRSSEHHARRPSVDRSAPAVHDTYDSMDEYDYEPREQRHSRRLATTQRHDRSVSRRGFGIRSESKERRSNDSLNAGKHEPAYADNYRRDYASDAEYREPVRRKDTTGRDDRDARHNDRYREANRYTSDAEDRRHHHHHDQPRYDDDPHASRSTIPDSTKLAAGGLASAAALYGLSRDKGRREEDPHEDERDVRRQTEQQPERDHRRQPEHSERDARRQSEHSERDARRQPEQPERETRRQPEQERRHAEAPYPSERQDDDRGLGFAFEGPPKPREATTNDRSLPDRATERAREDAPASMPEMPMDPDEEYRRRMLQTQRELGLAPPPSHDTDPERERRRREREARLAERHDRTNGDAVLGARAADKSPLRSSFEDDVPESSVASSRASELRRKPSIIDQAMPSEPTAQIIDNSQSEKRENRVRIVDPPTEEEDKRPRGILKKPTVKFPEDHNTVREGVAPLKDSTKKGIPPGARWTKIDRRLVNPEALEEAKERYEERLDCVIVLRVLTKEEIQKLADRTKELRDRRFEAEGKLARRRDRDRDRRDHDEYSDDGLEDWERDEKKPIRMLEAPSQPETSDRRSDRREREGSYVSSRSGRD